MTEEKKELTPKELKEQSFKDNPDRFVSLDDIVIAIMRSEQGPMIYIKPHTRQEAIMAKGELDIAVMRRILDFDKEVAKAKAQAIIPPKGSLINFMRGKK